MRYFTNLFVVDNLSSALVKNWTDISTTWEQKLLSISLRLFQKSFIIYYAPKTLKHSKAAEKPWQWLSFWER